MNARDMIDGYEAPIHRGLWERILMLGAPRLWSAIWIVLNAYAALMLLTTVGAWYALIPAVLWPLGQGVLLLLTQWDVQWDDVLLASGKYRSFYEAG